MALEKMSSVETDWYVTQQGDRQARDFIFKDFCDYILVIKTFADLNDNTKLQQTEIVHINSNDGSSVHKKYDELDPPLKDALERANFPIVK